MSSLYASKEQVVEYTGYVHKKRQAAFLVSVGMPFTYDGKGALKVPLVEIHKAIGIESEAPAEIKTDWIDAKKVPRNKNNVEERRV